MKKLCMITGIIILFVLMHFLAQAHSSQDVSIGKEILDHD
jgi:hypothetical protein